MGILFSRSFEIQMKNNGKLRSFVQLVWKNWCYMQLLSILIIEKQLNWSNKSDSRKIEWKNNLAHFCNWIEIKKIKNKFKINDPFFSFVYFTVLQIGTKQLETVNCLKWTVWLWPDHPHSKPNRVENIWKIIAPRNQPNCVNSNVCLEEFWKLSTLSIKMSQV